MDNILPILLCNVMNFQKIIGAIKVNMTQRKWRIHIHGFWVSKHPCTATRTMSWTSRHFRASTQRQKGETMAYVSACLEMKIGLNSGQYLLVTAEVWPVSYSWQKDEYDGQWSITVKMLNPKRSFSVRDYQDKNETEMFLLIFSLHRDA